MSEPEHPGYNNVDIMIVSSFELGQTYHRDGERTYPFECRVNGHLLGIADGTRCRVQKMKHGWLRIFIKEGDNLLQQVAEKLKKIADSLDWNQDTQHDKEWYECTKLARLEGAESIYKLACSTELGSEEKLQNALHQYRKDHQEARDDLEAYKALKMDEDE